MPNDEEEIIIEPQKIDEPEVEVEEPEPKVETKPIETPEAKRARLKRQLEQLDKKHGFKDEVKEVKPEAGLSNKDVLYLAKANINEADIDEIVNYAQKMGVTVKDAHEHYAPILKERQEERRTAAATVTKGGNRGVAKETPEAIVAEAEKGNLPDESDAAIEKLAAARIALRANRVK